MRSVVDRFLEHSRIYYFENAGRPEIFLGSPDWMPRNFFRRIEAVFPMEDPALRERVKSELLAISLADNLKSWQLQANGEYARRRPSAEAPRRSQLEFLTPPAAVAKPAPAALAKPAPAAEAELTPFGAPA